jgi:hypothetical protein
VLVVRLRAPGPADQDQQADGLTAVVQGPRPTRAFSSDPFSSAREGCARSPRVRWDLVNCPLVTSRPCIVHRLS